VFSTSKCKIAVRRKRSQSTQEFLDEFESSLDIESDGKLMVKKSIVYSGVVRVPCALGQKIVLRPHQ